MGAAIRPELLKQVQEARQVTDVLFETIPPEALYERPVAERHRLIFYVGHLEAFDWNLIGRKALGAASFHSTFDKLFEFGIDPPEGSTTVDQPSDWPGIDEVHDYKMRTRDALDRWMAEAPEQLIHVALEHRLMHAETLAYMLHNLDYERKRPQAEAMVSRALRNGARMIEIPEGTITLGQSQSRFGWDNEYTQHEVGVPGFRINKYKVTNAEYLEFVRDGAEPSHFWLERGGNWFWRGMFKEIPLPQDWPVYVTQQQASEYAAWRGSGLPTEIQFHRAAFGSLQGERSYPWGEAQPDASHGNFDFNRWDPAPVTAYPEGDSAFGVAQLVGNGWEWTSTVFSPFPGFEPFSFYPGYSSNFFDGNHYVMKGASPRTAACFLRRSFRNWFRGRYPYVYATFRLVGD